VDPGVSLELCREEDIPLSPQGVKPESACSLNLLKPSGNFTYDQV
jgi:hypothetical protein